MWVGESRRALGGFPSARSPDVCLPTCRAFVRSGANSLVGAVTQKIHPCCSDLRVLGISNRSAPDRQVLAVLAAGTFGGAGIALAHATPTPGPPPPPPATSQPCDAPDAPEAGEAPDQPGAPGSDNVQDGDQGGSEVPDAPCG
jgi:hypothetical protein